MHTDNEALLQTQITNEVKFRGVAVSAETKAGEDADAFLQAQVGGLWGGLQTIEADSKTRDSALDVKLTQERTRAQGAEDSLSGRIDTEIMDRKSDINRLDGRIDFITNNVDVTAIDSLSET